jgi:hypothetical protein
MIEPAKLIASRMDAVLQLELDLFQGWFRRLHCEAHGFEQSEKLQHRMSDPVLHCGGRLSSFLCDFKIGHPGKECEFNHSVLQGRDYIQRCSNESPLFCDVDGGNRFGFVSAFPQRLAIRAELPAKALDGTPVCHKYKPSQRPFILFAKLGGSVSYLFVEFRQDLFGRLSVPQNTQQETEEQPIRSLKKYTESSFIASRYPWD